MGIIATIFNFFGCSGLKSKDGGKPPKEEEADASVELHKNRPVYTKLTERRIDVTADTNLLHVVFDNLSGKLPKDDEKKYDAVLSWNKSRQAIYMIWVFKSEMNKGGYSQFYSGSHGHFHKHLPEVFRRIGANRLADLTERANHTVEERIEKDIKNQDALLEELSDLDAEFHELFEKGDLRQIQIDYIRQQKKDFVDP